MLRRIKLFLLPHLISLVLMMTGWFISIFYVRWDRLAMDSLLNTWTVAGLVFILIGAYIPDTVRLFRKKEDKTEKPINEPKPEEKVINLSVQEPKKTGENRLRISFLLFLILSFFCKEKTENKKPLLAMKKESKPRLIFFGDSLTAGYKLPSEAFSFPSLIYAKLKKEGYSYEYVNAGLSGDTTSGGLERLDWVISEGVDVFVLELGANDSMRGIPIPLIKKNLTAIIQKVRDKNPKVKILLVPMRTFPNLGPRYTQDFYKLYVEISKKENVPLSPFLLEKVAGIPSLNQSDGIHPTVKGHELLAETLYPSVQKLLAK